MCMCMCVISFHAKFFRGVFYFISRQIFLQCVLFHFAPNFAVVCFNSFCTKFFLGVFISFRDKFFRGVFYFISRQIFLQCVLFHFTPNFFRGVFYFLSRQIFPWCFLFYFAPNFPWCALFHFAPNFFVVCFGELRLRQKFLPLFLRFFRSVTPFTRMPSDS
jgi:hypothetical protein